MKGIDISMFQENINYSILQRAGIEVAYVKATQGTDYIDPIFAKHVEGIKAVGMPYGPYHYMSERTDPAQQAEDFWEAIKNTGFGLVPMLDIEDNTMGRSAAAVTDRVLQFLEAFSSLSGIDCVIYTGGYFGRDTLDSRVKGYKAWIAHYGVDTPMDTGFANVVGHQYTGTGSIEGYSGDVDLNNFTEGVLLGSSTVPVSVASAAIPVDQVATASAFLGSYYKIKLVQLVLNAVGYNLEADGRCGRLTAAAIVSFQQSYNLTQDYKFGSECLSVAYDLIKGNTCGKKYTTPLYTRIIQHILGLSVDGVFWIGTEAVVIVFQNNSGLIPDGVVGVNTWKALLLG